jgi:molecular chaperone DnaK
MPNDLVIQNLLPSLQNTGLVQDKLTNSTFIGIDFGTSTTVVSYAISGDSNNPLKIKSMPIRQLNADGSHTKNHLLPSCIAYFDNRLFVGQTAKQLKSKLTFGKNLWYSFKMMIGTDNGPVYFGTELPNGHPLATVENPLDAAKVFFKNLKQEIDYFIINENLPRLVYYSVSIPASFEANQRKDLKEALNAADIPFQDSLFIDEPNAAFLSYLIEANNNNHQNYNIPVDSPLHILVFDFGAGTCDISILELGRKSGRLYSKNIAISKFEQLGGDDIDKKIVREVLLPQLLKQNSIDPEDIRTPEYNKILLPKLQPIAEHLKIQACKAVARNLVGRELPSLAKSEEKITLNQNFQFVLPKYRLEYSIPSMSFKEFSKIMQQFTTETSEYDFEDDLESVKSIFTVISSALQKANMTNDELDLVLLIGGSSYNPYVQTSLRNYFKQSELEVPRDLQAHVSSGASVNSFLQNGLNIDIIKPIVSEPILIILEKNIPRTVVREGTEIPCNNITIDDLHPQKDGQKVLEIPICVSTKDKILTNIKISNDKGFKKNDTISLVCDISHDKLIYFRAYVRDIEVDVEPINPFSNASLTSEEIAEKRLVKALNEAAKINGGKPPVKLLNELANFYVKLEKHFKAAETFELIQYLDPLTRNETYICYHYSMAGKRKQSNKWAQIAYDKNPHASNAYNLALVKEQEGRM